MRGTKPMLMLFLSFLLILALTVSLAALLLTARAGTGIKVLGLAIVAGLLAVVYLAGTELLGRPKPARLALIERGADEATIAAARAVEGEAIYLWLVLPGDSAPRAYVLPWSIETAEALRRAEAAAEANGTEARFGLPFRSAEAPAGQRIYAPPPLPMPHKP